MELKKNPKADLEKSKSIFFLVGLFVALGVVLTAFNISSTTDIVEELERPEEVFFEEEAPEQTRQEEIINTPPPPPQQVVEVLNIVDDSEDIDEEFVPEDTEATEDMEVEIVETVEVAAEEEEEEIFMIVEKMPVFPGGDLGLRKWIASNVKYPNIARESGIEGKVYVRFCVTSTGKVEKVSIARGVDPILDKEAIRVVSKLPKWTPGEQRGKKVSVWYTVPINFQLQ